MRKQDNKMKGQMSMNIVIIGVIGLLVLVFLAVLIVNKVAPESNFSKWITENNSFNISQYNVSNYSFGVRNKTSGCSFDYLPLPDPDCTTGNIFPNLTKDDICWSGYSASVRDVPESLKNEVYESYGVVNREPNSYEIDHLIPLSLGSTNDISNLFPQKYNMTLGARVKDKVENCFHRKVCDGELDLSLAQHIMATNWTEGMGMCGVTDG